MNASAKSYGRPARNIEVIRQCWSCLTQCRSCKTQFTVPCYTLHTSQARWLHRFLTCSCTMFLDSATVIDPAMNSAVPPPLTYRCCSCCASHSGSRVTNVRTAAGATARAPSPALYAPFLCRTVLPIAAPAVPLAGSSSTDVSTAAEQLDQPHPQPYTSWSSSSFTSHYCSCCVSHSSRCNSKSSVSSPVLPFPLQNCTFHYCSCCGSHSGSSATDVSTAAGATAPASTPALYSPFLSKTHFQLLPLLRQPLRQQRNRCQHRRRSNSKSSVLSPILPFPLQCPLSITAPAVPAILAAAQQTSAPPQVQQPQPHPQPCTSRSSLECPCSQHPVHPQHLLPHHHPP